MSAKVRTIDYGRRMLRSQAEKRYGEGDYLSALRYTGRETALYGADAESYARLADIYENMGLYSSALNCWYRYADVCSADDLPEAYEGLAVNYLNLGNDAQSAYYYNKLIDADDTLTGGDKAQIAEMFSVERASGFRFVYPPELADYRAETARGGAALKNGDLEGATFYLSQVKKGAKVYAAAQEMLAVATLLKGDAEGAEEICLALLKENENDVQALSTLSAIYSEEDRREESRKIAEKLCSMQGENADEKYKIATVACENGMHEKALALFTDLEKEFPYDGNLLYFKAVAAAECGKDALAENTLAYLTQIYPDAEVAKYYLKRLRLRKNEPGRYERPPFTYFYKIPQEEKERRVEKLEALSKTPLNAAAQAAEALLDEGVLRWCFDEMDGMEQGLQWLAVRAAARGGEAGSGKCDEFLREVLLDCEVRDGVKIETLRLLFERGKELSFGVVICNIYKTVHMPEVTLGKTRRKLFLRGYAAVASKFAVIGDAYGRKIRRVIEKTYSDLYDTGFLDAVKTPEALAAAVYLLCDFKEAGRRAEDACLLFSAPEKEVRAILAAEEIASEAEEAYKKELSGNKRKYRDDFAAEKAKPEETV
ncbi:MAG: hypothetical protein SPH68_06600 [Candidatus Borkfalkiaceae bacterium]|nr:hypothetical protein [Clostridia bacterium]MDY6223807.1 hypothetical protein [Christensenellaceae bacterium]